MDGLVLRSAHNGQHSVTLQATESCMGEAGEHIILPTGRVFLKQRVKYVGPGRDFNSGLFQKQCREGYRSWYSYFSNLVARMSLP